MNNMMSKQRGVTFLGWCTILAIIAFFVLITLRLFPLYNEKMQVITAMNSVASRPGADKLSSRDILKYFVRNAQIGGTRRFHSNNIKDYAKVNKPKKAGEPLTLQVTYEAENKFFQDVYFVMKFDKTVELKGE